MTRKQEILEAIFGFETIEQYKMVKILKFTRYEISNVEILMWIPEQVQQAAEAEPDTKVFFEEDVYFTALPDTETSTGFNYGIGVDPDKNKYFNFQQE